MTWHYRKVTLFLTQRYKLLHKVLLFLMWGNHPWQRFIYLRKFQWLQICSNSPWPALRLVLHIYYITFQSGQSSPQDNTNSWLYTNTKHLASLNIQGSFPQNSSAIPILTSSIFLRINWVLKVYYNRLIKSSCIKLWNNALFLFLDQKIPVKDSTKCDLCNKPYQTILENISP